MKIKASVTGLIFATSMIAAAGPSQAAMVKHGQFSGTGWHMVPKSSGIKPAENWQEYASGVYTQPITGKNPFLLGQ
ncbi:hypothetical protein [Legionella drancourtii]|uniref:Uncharacterized protein n=1 Tax=Legionella drancourtii LLAP12 TaxID=658187 RepID=G9EQ08_9GAMM|nr:hypothetical protein [Legionella drancourtii]EHL30583.1 hypothetical protein LDG_7351 [Legionella drancourtii LLAP12]